MPTFLHGFPVWLSLRGAAEKCAIQRLALENIHPVNAARKYFHHDVIAFKSEQEYLSSDRTEHSFQRLLISEKNDKQGARIKSTVASHKNAFDSVCARFQDHKNQQLLQWLGEAVLFYTDFSLTVTMWSFTDFWVSI